MILPSSITAPHCLLSAALVSAVQEQQGGTVKEVHVVPAEEDMKAGESQ